jgi:antitoxin MazE
MRSQIKRWGNSAAVRLPGKLLAEARIEADSPITLSVEGRKIIIEANTEPLADRLRLPFSETDLINSLNAETAHADELAIPLDSETGD